MAKFGTNASGATISWRDNSSLDAMPWVRCASGNVLSEPWQRENAIAIHNVVVSLSPGENGREHISVP